MMIPKINPNHKRRVPKQSVRNSFSKSVRDAIYDRDKGICQGCMSKGTEIHHVFYRSRGGRGVYTNGVTLCTNCHKNVHNSAYLTDYWINVFTKKYGHGFYKDEWDK